MVDARFRFGDCRGRLLLDAPGLGFRLNLWIVDRGGGCHARRLRIVRLGLARVRTGATLRHIIRVGGIARLLVGAGLLFVNGILVGGVLVGRLVLGFTRGILGILLVVRGMLGFVVLALGVRTFRRRLAGSRTILAFSGIRRLRGRRSTTVRGCAVRRCRDTCTGQHPRRDTRGDDTRAQPHQEPVDHDPSCPTIA